MTGYIGEPCNSPDNTDQRANIDGQINGKQWGSSKVSKDRKGHHGCTLFSII